MPKSTTKTYKWLFICLANILLISALNAQIFFNSEGGIAVDVLPKEESGGAGIYVRGSYGAQMQLGYNILFETEFSFLSDSLFESKFMEEVPAAFSLDKLSLSYNIAGYGFNSRISAFAGTHDVFGSDIFAKRFLGARPFESEVFEHQVGLPQNGIITIDGYGLDVTTVFNSSIATAFYTYYNSKYDKDNINFDLRFVSVTNIGIFDIAFGTSLPFDDTDENGDPVVMLIRRADLHTSLTALIGDNPYANLYIQVGFPRIQINPDPGNEVFALEDMHLFIEPRFSVNKINASLYLFMLPQETVDLISYIDFTTGGGIHISGTTNIGRVKAEFGGNITTSYQDALDTNFNIADLSFVLSPYTSLELNTGELKITLPIKVLEYNNADKMFSTSISYKASF